MEKYGIDRTNKLKKLEEWLKSLGGIENCSIERLEKVTHILLIQSNADNGCAVEFFEVFSWGSRGFMMKLRLNKNLKIPNEIFLLKHVFDVSFDCCDESFLLLLNLGKFNKMIRLSVRCDGMEDIPSFICEYKNINSICLHSKNLKGRN